MTLAQLLERIPVRHVTGPTDVPVGQVTDRDGDVVSGDVFVALRGARVDGHDRVGALGHAAALVVERDLVTPEGPTVVRVDDTRATLGPLCAAVHDHPSRAMAVVGVTGTNGKTSTAFLVAAMARAAGWRAGIIGTTGHFIDGTRLDAEHTTPDAPRLQALLARMRDAGCALVAMEASSIGLAARRCDAVDFRAAIFTNLTRDHLDWHGTMEDYAAAKSRLFRELLVGTAVLNARDPWSKVMAPSSRPCLWFNDGDLNATQARCRADGTTARFHTPAGDFEGGMRLVGAHNLDNALGAMGGALAAGVPLEACARGLADCPPVPGRLEAVPNTRGVAVFVDYAHTDDALDRVLTALRALTEGRILTVFGCGGDRDRGKRPRMGAAAARGSDYVVVTSDNPRSESPDAIVADIVPGIGAAPHVVIVDRVEAIRHAITQAGPGDVVLIAGKGHEATQEIGGVRHPFDDRHVAAEALR